MKALQFKLDKRSRDMIIMGAIISVIGILLTNEQPFILKIKFGFIIIGYSLVFFGFGFSLGLSEEKERKS